MNISSGLSYLLVGFLLAIASFNQSILAQSQIVNTPRASPRASVTQTVGITTVEINYSRPAVRGRKIWGSLVPYGMFDPGWGTADLAPWRVGADENTTISFSTDVSVNDVPVPAGTYALFMVIEESGEVEILLSSNYESWGSYFYEASEIVARINSSLLESEFNEYLTFVFTDFSENSAYCVMNWEEISVPFEIEVDLNATVVASLRQEMKGKALFSYLGPMEAAQWCVQHNTNLEEALKWASLAANMNEEFITLKIKADVLDALGKSEESMVVMKRAIPLASVYELHGYGRQLIQNGQVDKALEIFEANAKEHPNTWPINYGLARGYSAQGDYKKAKVYLLKAKKNCPDDINLALIEENLKKLDRSEDIN